MKKRIVSVLAGIALVAAVLGASANVAGVLSTADAPVAVACNSGSGSGGGC